LTLADLPAVMHIERRSFPSPTQEALYRYELTQNQLAHYQALTRLEEPPQEVLLGYGGYWMIADEMHISIIAVEPTLRGRGLGELLLLNMLQSAFDHNANLITLEVRENNHAAQGLYHKYRFEEVGRRLRYYKDTGEDALLMTVFLDMTPDYAAFLQQRQNALFRELAPASQ
jgi:ribosomal-protein-alanine N-acetyltransferase